MTGKHRLRPNGWPKPVRQLTVAGLVRAATLDVPTEIPDVDDDYGVDDSHSW